MLSRKLAKTARSAAFQTASASDWGWRAVAGPRATAADAGSVTGDVAAGFGLTPDELKAHDWSCRLTPAGTTACSPPGRGLPAFGAPADRPPTYLVHVFDTATSEYLGYGRMIRTDLYQGQICPSTGDPYIELAHLGYFECFNPAP